MSFEVRTLCLTLTLFIMNQVFKSPVQFVNAISLTNAFSLREIDILKELSEVTGYELIPMGPFCFQIVNNTVVPILDENGNQLYTSKGNPMMKPVHKSGFIRKVRHYYRNAENDIKEYFTIEYQRRTKSFKKNDDDSIATKDGEKIPYYYTYKEDLGHLFGTNNVINTVNKLFSGKLNPLWLILDLEPEEIKRDIPVLQRQ